MVGTGGVNSVFIRNYFPEFGSDLVSALSSLDVNDFSHLFFFFETFYLFYLINYQLFIKKVEFKLKITTFCILRYKFKFK